MAKLITPLAPNVPIVDKDGNPTPYFQRILQELTDAKINASLIDAIGGDPDENAVVTWDDTANALTFVPHDELLALDSLTDVDTSTTPPDDGQALIWDDANSEWIPGDVASGSSGGSPWEVIYANGALTNPTTSVDVNISAFEEVIVMGRGITCGTSGFRSVLVSTNGGASYYNTSGDYVAVLNTGGESATFTAGNHETAATLARDCGVHICGTHLNGTSKLLRHINTGGAHRIFAANTLPITHLRVCSIASSGAAINNLTGGAVYVIGKRIAAAVGSMAQWALAGSGYTATGVWDFAVDGAVANVNFTGLNGFNEWFLMVEGVSKSVSGGMEVRLSVDNGTNYLATSGDYQSITSAGVTANTASLGGIHITATTAARDGMMHILFPSHAGSVKGHSLTTGTFGKLVNASVPNAIRLFPTAGGNFTAGKVKLYVR